MDDSSKIKYIRLKNKPINSWPQHKKHEKKVEPRIDMEAVLTVIMVFLPFQLFLLLLIGLFF
tara:strand:+ start:192 stop:377 length:186 start_codon:yes stop_codon:yes gene_type:complete